MSSGVSPATTSTGPAPRSTPARRGPRARRAPRGRCRSAAPGRRRRRCGAIVGEVGDDPLAPVAHDDDEVLGVEGGDGGEDVAERGSARRSRAAPSGSPTACGFPRRRRGRRRRTGAGCSRGRPALQVAAGEACSPYPAPGPRRTGDHEAVAEVPPAPSRSVRTRRIRAAPGAGIEPASYPHSKCGRPCQQSNPGWSSTSSVERSDRAPRQPARRPIPVDGPERGRMSV